MDSLTFEQWIKEFKPVDKKTGEVFTGYLIMDACLWDTYDDMVKLRKLVQEGIIDKHHVWTVSSGPRSKLILSQGLYNIDALGYILTNVSHINLDIPDITF